MSSTRVKPLFIADQLALDFLNTWLRVEGEERDLLASDRDVRRWLELAGIMGERDHLPPYEPGSLLNAAVALRATLGDLVARRKAGKLIDPTGLNAFLARGKQDVQLVSERGGGLRLANVFGRGTPPQLLMPVALSGAELLASGDFTLVRKCGSEECLLQFYDRTKSHRRRWCSMATCGNRHKVESFRRRQASDD
jgi:predicted RNA-binding Zn ribbon-like protein